MEFWVHGILEVNLHGFSIYLRLFVHFWYFIYLEIEIYHVCCSFTLHLTMATRYLAFIHFDFTCLSFVISRVKPFFS